MNAHAIISNVANMAHEIADRVPRLARNITNELDARLARGDQHDMAALQAALSTALTAVGALWALRTGWYSPRRAVGAMAAIAASNIITQWWVAESERAMRSA